MTFRYLREPLFLACVAVYAVNRFMLKQISGNEFVHGYMNDLLCIPFWVPIMLWGMRRCGLRKDDSPPTAGEILIPLVLWSFLFELLLPVIPPFRGRFVADPSDILCYVIGACVAALCWCRPTQRKSPSL